MMKKLLIPFAALIVMAASCGENAPISSDNAGAGESRAITSNEQTAHLATPEQIDTFTAQIDKAINHTNIERYYPVIYSKKDAVFLYKPDGELKRLTCGLYEENVESRAFYYLNEGKLVFHRKREWHFNDNPPFAKETICYIKNDGVIDMQERKVILTQGEKPGSLLGSGFYPINLDGDSLFAAIKNDFNNLKAAADKSEINVKPQ